MPFDASQFREAPWRAPLDPVTEIDRIPAEATMSGLFLAAVVDMAKQKGVTLPSARPSYTAFRPYLLREHCALMVEAACAIWPEEPLRQGLRRIGRGAPRALVQSMIGRVVLGSVEGPTEILRAMAKSYPLHSKPGSLEVIELGPGRVIVELRDIHHFLDSHHIGVFEGVLKYAEVLEPRVRLRSHSPLDADLLCEWKGR